MTLRELLIKKYMIKKEVKIIWCRNGKQHDSTDYQSVWWVFHDTDEDYLDSKVIKCIEEDTKLIIKVEDNPKCYLYL